MERPNVPNRRAEAGRIKLWGTQFSRVIAAPPGVPYEVVPGPLLD